MSMPQRGSPADGLSMPAMRLSSVICPTPKAHQRHEIRDGDVEVDIDQHRK
jgi:hypothetical protein